MRSSWVAEVGQMAVACRKSNILPKIGRPLFGQNAVAIIKYFLDALRNRHELSIVIYVIYDVNRNIQICAYTDISKALYGFIKL